MKKSQLALAAAVAIAALAMASPAAAEGAGFDPFGGWWGWVQSMFGAGGENADFGGFIDPNG